MNPVRPSSAKGALSLASAVIHSHEWLPLIKPKPLKRGDAIGIFTPSWPAHAMLREKYQHAIGELHRLGFKVIEGKISRTELNQGYRSASPEERAEEFMELLLNPEVKCLMATIGGHNSSSMVPFLDFKEIRNQRKIICGYSDVTSLHFAIHKYSGLSTFYGPSLVPVFGEYPRTFDYAFDQFWNAASGSGQGELTPPIDWSHQFIDATQAEWKSVKRSYQKNDGWKVLSRGAVAKTAAYIANLETFLSFAGTPFFPDLKNAILVIDETDAPFSKMERNYRHLQLMGVFDALAGLIISKPGAIDPEGCPVSRETILMEIIGKRNYPIIVDFDCGHTFPMVTLGQGIPLSIYANAPSPSIFIDEPAVNE